jgi:hypothetical protein
MCNPLGLEVENQHHPSGHHYNDGEKHSQHQQSPQQRRPPSFGTSGDTHRYEHWKTLQQLRQDIRAAIDVELLLTCNILQEDEDDNCSVDNDVMINWNVVYGLFQQLLVVVPPCPPQSDANSGLPSNNSSTCPASWEEDDPLGRLLLGRLLSRDAPTDILRIALAVFPESLCHNPAAFFTACRDVTNPTVVVRLMMTHLATISLSSEKKECPYPWILSKFVSLEGAQAILQAFPEGVWYLPPMPSGQLRKLEIAPEKETETALDAANGNSYNLLDYILMSPDMVEQRNFDETLWNKIKLILVAAECCAGRDSEVCSEISPVRTIVNRILGCPGKFLNGLANRSGLANPLVRKAVPSTR